MALSEHERFPPDGAFGLFICNYWNAFRCSDFPLNSVRNLEGCDAFDCSRTGPFSPGDACSQGNSLLCSCHSGRWEGGPARTGHSLWLGQAEAAASPSPATSLRELPLPTRVPVKSSSGPWDVRATLPMTLTSRPKGRVWSSCCCLFPALASPLGRWGECVSADTPHPPGTVLRAESQRFRSAGPGEGPQTETSANVPHSRETTRDYAGRELL